MSHEPDFHLSLTRFCTLRELCTQIRWRKIRYSVASLLTNPVSSSTQPQGIISNTPQVMRGVRVCSCGCVYASQKYGRSPRSSFCHFVPKLSRCSLIFAPRGWRLPPPVLFLQGRAGFVLSHEPDFHLSLTRSCALRELRTQIRWRKTRYSVTALLTNPVSSSTQPQGIISNTPQKSVGCSRMRLRLCLRVAKIRTFAPFLVPLRCAGTIALLSDFCSAGWAAPAACSFFKDERVLCCRTIMPPQHDQSIS